MTSTVHTGQKCRLKRPIIAMSGRIERHSEGRIRYVSENLGRLLFVVDLDRGGSTVLFPDEVDLIDRAA